MDLIIKRELFFCFLFIFLLSFTSSLGLTPAKKTMNFQPGETVEINYLVFGVGADTELNVSIYGYFAQYSTISKEFLKGENSFTITVNMPNEVDSPGPNRLVVQIEEVVDPELLTSTVGTSVTLRGALIINVPYPGKYLETSIKGHNANLGEPVKFEIGLKSQGDQTITVKPRIEIENEFGEVLETLILSERTLQSQEGIELKKVLETGDYNSGNYVARLIAPYDSKEAINSYDFRIGELTIEMTNYSQQILIDKYQTFFVELESGWNDQIDGASAEITIFENDAVKSVFDTTATSLSPWQKKKINGFFDTAVFTPGFKDGEMIISYFGRDVGKTQTLPIKVEFIEKESNVLTMVIVATVVLLIILVLLFFFLKKRSGAKKNESKK